VADAAFETELRESVGKPSLELRRPEAVRVADKLVPEVT
jgi:hypothetical protein